MWGLGSGLSVQFAGVRRFELRSARAKRRITGARAEMFSVYNGGDRCAGGRRTAGRPSLSTHLPTIQNIRRIPQNATSSSNVNGTAEAGGGDGGVSLGQPRVDLVWVR